MTTSSPNINDLFFNSSYKHAWKNIIPPGLSEAEAEFIIQEASLKNESTVLDLMCGYGRHALELGRRGIKVTAIDNLQDYIDEINGLATKENLPVHGICSSVTEVNLEDKFDAILNMGNSFSFLDASNAALLLSMIKNSLHQDGAFIINSWMVAEIALKYFRENDWHYAGDYKCVLEYQYKFNPSRIESEQTIISPEGSVERLQGIDYIYSLNEMEQMCREAGLKITAMYSTPKKRTYKLGDGKIYLVIRHLNWKA